MGRARDAELEQRLLAAAWEVVTASGYDTLSFARVAERAGAHRTDIYRRWDSKAQLVTAAMAAHLPGVPEFDTGSLRGDIRAYLGALWQSWSADWVDVAIGVLADLDAEAERTFRTMTLRRAQPLRDAIVRAVRRGELVDMPEPAMLGDLLEGPLMHRRLVGRQVMTLDELDALADIVHGLMGARVTR
ncbi:TetR/AcrR family transcriptional regulator [Microbacterium sp. ARD32]|uniref:TetR/AcrR family transcriptional regulator n=1 Tax=Microbacterium sp. ARD32 TaxID=2962577 RepID=UPI0028826474|nr:TetR/AcrR family transcriptional regulator [Microbacterium sp. ARD32]MDT0158713.1 TetR/AcrR family transcriptional regulator [Microbacterium sp. ARD32]